MNKNEKGLGLQTSALIFGSASLALILGTRFAIPFLSELTGLESILFWFTVAGLGIFLPMLLLSYVMLKREGLRLERSTWEHRLRFRMMNKADWLWSLGAILVIGLFSVFILHGLERLIGEFENQPTFMDFEPLTPGRYWILLFWAPYWLLNILGEEILWRGVMLPRQEIAFGNRAWLIHGVLWGIFHLAFGWRLLVTLVPILLIQPYVVQRRRNSWIGVVIHAVINGPSFLAISFGLL